MKNQVGDFGVPINSNRLEARVERLEDALYQMIDAFQLLNPDYTWQPWNDELKKFKEEIEEERNP